MTTKLETPVLARIAKLLALARGRGATEAEASLAAEHVQRLLQEHNLTLAEVEANGGSAEGSREKQLTDRRAMYAYQRTLMAALARNNFCLHQVDKVFDPEGKSSRSATKGRWNHRHLLVGRAINVNVTLMTYDYLTEALTRAAQDEGYDVRVADGKLFLEGAVSRLQERLTERRQQREAEDAKRAQQPVGNGTHRELVLSDVYGSEADLNNDTLNGFPLGTTAANRRKADERDRQRKELREKLVAEGVDQDVAWYRSYGYDEEQASHAAARDRKRRGRPGRGRARSWTQGDEAHYRKINSAAYKAGRVAGGNVGLDDQVGRASRKRIGS